MAATKADVARNKNLLFVNKDLASISSSQSETALRCKINCHVQHWQRGTNFATKQRALKGAAPFRDMSTRSMALQRNMATIQTAEDRTTLL